MNNTLSNRYAFALLDVAKEKIKLKIIEKIL